MFFKIHRFLIGRVILILALLGGLFGTIPANSVHAATLTVINTNDSGPGSLRQAISDAAPGDTLSFAPSLAGGMIALTSQLTISKNLTIDGSNLNPQLVLSGQNTSRIMEITINAEVTLSDLIFTGGASTEGGAIYVSGNAQLTMENSTFYQNQASASGGAISVDGNGIFVLLNSTLYQNLATISGGGIFLDENAQVSVFNTTMTSNQASAGGGIFAAGSSLMMASNLTIVHNTVGDHSEIEIQAQSGIVLYNTQVACVPGNTKCVANQSSSGVTLRNSFAESGTLASFGLAELTDNGGPTKTMALLPGSSLIDAGDDSVCTNSPVNNLDQRSVTRPQGSHCDIGAFEYVFPPTATPMATNTATFTPTNTPTLTPTASNTPIPNCNAVYHGPLTLNGGLSMSITNQTGLALGVQDVLLIWNHDHGHSVGADKTLRLQQASLNGVSFWNGDASGPSFTMAPSGLSIPPGTSTILFSFHQSYDFMDGSEQIFFVLRTNGCQPYPIDSSTAPVTHTPTPTLTATPPYSYNPLYLSLTGNQTIGGVSSADEDIFRFDGQNWSLFFDGSDVGVGSPDLFAFAIVDADTILMSFTSTVTVNGITAQPQDILRFDATSLGSTTAGTFSPYFDGSDVGFDTTAENIDSLTLLPDGRLLISTTGNPAVPGLTGLADEDILAFTASTLGNNTSGTWSLYFDGSDVGLSTSSNEDIDALDVTSNGDIYLSTVGDFAVTGVSGFDEDVFVCVPISLGSATVCNYSPTLYFDGSTWGLAANDVDAFNYLATGVIPTAVATNTPTATPTRTASPTPIPTLPPVSEGSIRFAAIGDYGKDGQAEGAVANLVKSWNPDFIITTGDNNYPLGAAETIDQNIGQYYHEFIHPYVGSYGAGAGSNRFFPSLGNHDWDTGSTLPYQDYFTLPGNERYYDFVWGPVHFFVLDSDGREPDGRTNSSTQALWLQTQLANSTSAWNLVYFHHAPFSSGIQHGSTTVMRWPFQAWGADVVLSGHDHLYERIILNDFPYFVDGLGGAAIYGFTTPVPGSEVRYNGDYGALLVEADASYMTFQFITVTGAVIDSYTLSAASTATPSATASPSQTPSIELSPTDSATPAFSTATFTSTPLDTGTPTETLTATFTPAATASPSQTFTATSTPTSTLTRTSTATNTSSDLDLIFADGFESGDLSAWTSSSTDLGDLSVTPSAALVGSQGLQAVIDDNIAIFVRDDTPNSESRYRARFYFDPNSVSMVSGNAHFLLQGYAGTSRNVLRVDFRFSNGAYQVSAGAFTDSSSWVSTPWSTITDASHAIELDWRAASAVGANNGSLTLWVDGVHQADLTGIDNDTRRIDLVAFGATSGIGSGTRGTCFFDSFESRRSSYIGP